MKFKRFKDWKEETKVLILRMWMAGAVMFFMAMDAIGGAYQDGIGWFIRIISLLVVGLFLTNLFIVNPVERMMFNVHNNAKKHFEKNLLIRFTKHLIHLVHMLIIVLLILLSYMLINQLLFVMGVGNPEGRPPLMFEPFSFGFLYGINFLLTMLVFNKIKQLIVVLNERHKISKDANLEG